MKYLLLVCGTWTRNALGQLSGFDGRFYTLQISAKLLFQQRIYNVNTLTYLFHSLKSYGLQIATKP